MVKLFAASSLASQVSEIKSEQFKVIKTVNKFLLDFVDTGSSRENMELIFNTGVVKELDDLIGEKIKVEKMMQKINLRLRNC